MKNCRRSPVEELLQPLNSETAALPIQKFSGMGTQDTFCIGWLRSTGWLYQQTFIDLNSGAAIVRLYTRKSPLVAVSFLEETVLPRVMAQKIPLLKIFTDRGREFCGRTERHPYPLYLATVQIEHLRSAAASPQENSVCREFHQLIWEDFYRSAFCQKRYKELIDLQVQVDGWISRFNRALPK